MSRELKDWRELFIEELKKPMPKPLELARFRVAAMGRAWRRYSGGLIPMTDEVMHYINSI